MVHVALTGRPATKAEAAEATAKAIVEEGEGGGKRCEGGGACGVCEETGQCVVATESVWDELLGAAGIAGGWLVVLCAQRAVARSRCKGRLWGNNARSVGARTQLADLGLPLAWTDPQWMPPTLTPHQAAPRGKRLSARARGGLP